MAKKSSWMEHPTPSQEEMDAAMWCIDNDIKISPGGVNGKLEWTVDINLGKGYRRSPKSYGPKEIWEVYYNYCIYYYEKKKRKGLVKS